MIDVPGPDDGSELAVDADGLEGIALVADRGEHAAGLQQAREIDLVYRAVSKGQVEASAPRAAQRG